MLALVERYATHLWQVAPTDGVGSFLWQWGFCPLHPGTGDGVLAWELARTIVEWFGR